MHTHQLTGDRATDAAGIGPVDVALDTLGATPTADATMAAYNSLRGRGTLILIGGVRQDLAIPQGDLMHRRRTLRGSWMSDDKTVTTVWNLVCSGVLGLSAVELLMVDVFIQGCGAVRIRTLKSTTSRWP